MSKYHAYCSPPLTYTEVTRKELAYFGKTLTIYPMSACYRFAGTYWRNSSLLAMVLNFTTIKSNAVRPSSFLNWHWNNKLCCPNWNGLPKMASTHEFITKFCGGNKQVSTRRIYSAEIIVYQAPMAFSNTHSSIRGRSISWLWGKIKWWDCPQRQPSHISSDSAPHQFSCLL